MGLSWSRWSRWLHTYLSLVGFGALIFFSLTGLTLNHASFFERAKPVEAEVGGVVALPRRSDAEGTDTRWQVAVIESVRAEAGLKGALAEFSFEPDLAYLSFRAPGYGAEIELDPATGRFDGYEVREGSWAVLNDLHKGRGTDGAWSWVIDISAIVLLASGVTGLWLLWFVRKRRISGFVVSAVGVLAVGLVAFMTQ